MLLINARESEESRLAIIENGQLEEYYIERSSLGSTLGNVYKARITNIEKSIGAAFVEFGHDRQGFLHVSDLCMAAVGEGARELLATLQAAREHAHDDAMDGLSGEKGDEKKAQASGDDEQGQDQPGAKEQGASEADEDTEPKSEDSGPVESDGESGGEQADQDAEEEDDGEAREDSDEDVDEHAVTRDGDTGDEIEAEAPGFSGAAESLHELGEDSDESDEPADDGDEGRSAPDARSESIAFTRGDDDVDAESDDEDAAGGDDEAVAPSSEDAEASEAAGESASAVALATATEPAPENGAEVAPTGRSRRSRGGRRRGGRRGRGGQTEQAEQPEKDGRRGRGGRSGRAGRTPSEMPPIQDILQKGQEIVVQVIKDGIGTKGPTLTTYLSIPGRFMVLMPGINKRGVSRKVVDSAERNRLKSIVRELKVPDELGFIVRTAGVSASAEDLQRDLDYLLKVWNQMRVRVEEHKAPVLLYQENDLVIRTLRDMYDGTGEIIIDDAPTAEKARQFMSEIMPSSVDKVQLYDGERPLFAQYKIEDEIEHLLENRIELPSGGSLIIEQTEALVAIDVNSGRFKAVKGSGIEDTAFIVNSEAAKEIARQIRLRDLGGVVVVDFIDMRTERHRKALENLFKEALRRDRARIKVARFSPFGIIELTRQRVRPSLKRSVHSPCPYCVGTGYIPSDETSCLTVVRKVHDNLTKPGGVLVVTVRPEVAEAVLNQQRDTLLAMEKESHKIIFVRSDHRMGYEDVEVRAMVALPDDLDHRRA